ncbi:hypothetical protein [Peromfec virus RodF5_12]|uniref:Uncharacterized protein n=1 Tax=Peromfec virus RodF5_12 TaxID=2929336 RepID=A0A976N398_9VIRU|nr:hypothetical protein [Peromfec virus RodF5_12]
MNKADLEFLKQQNEELIRAIRVLVSEKVISQMQSRHRASHHSESFDSVKMDYTPTPLSSKPIKTQAQALEEILYQSGQLSQEAWERLNGIEYDIDVSEDEDAAFRDSDISEEFVQSPLASYHAHKVPPVESATESLGSHQTSVAETSDNSDATQPTPSEGVE